jgi:hypothetical protein
MTIRAHGRIGPICKPRLRRNALHTGARPSRANLPWPKKPVPGRMRQIGAAFRLRGVIQGLRRLAVSQLQIWNVDFYPEEALSCDRWIEAAIICARIQLRSFSL